MPTQQNSTTQIYPVSGEYITDSDPRNDITIVVFNNGTRKRFRGRVDVDLTGRSGLAPERPRFSMAALNAVEPPRFVQEAEKAAIDLLTKQPAPAPKLPSRGQTVQRTETTIYRDVKNGEPTPADLLLGRDFGITRQRKTIVNTWNGKSWDRHEEWNHVHPIMDFNARADSQKWKPYSETELLTQLARINDERNLFHHQLETLRTAVRDMYELPTCQQLQALKSLADPR